MPYSDRERSVQYQRDYWEKNKDRRNAQRRERRRTRAEEARAVQGAWRKANAERLNAANKERYVSDPEFREARISAAKEWHRNNADHKRRYDRTKKYGITMEQAWFVDSVTNCQATGIPISDEGRGKALDHNHETGSIRGVIATKVNKAIGLLDDDPTLFRAVADYLERTSRPDFRWDQS